MASFAEYTKKKKKKEQSAKGVSFTDYTKQVLGKDDIEVPLSQRDDDDIAPVKTTTEKDDADKWFKKGAFADGYQFGDVLKTAGSTVGDVAVGAVTGLGNMIEGVIDLGMYGLAGASSLVGADRLAKAAKETAQENLMQDGMSPINKWVSKNSLLGDKADMVSEGLGSVAAIIATGGLAGGAAAASGASAAGAGIASTIATTGLTGLSSWGSGMTEAYNSGATDGEALSYGAMKGTIDAGTELIFGGLGKGVKALGVSKGIGGLDDMFAKSASSKLAGWITNPTVRTWIGNSIEGTIKAGGEGAEEVLAGLGSSFAKKLTYMSDEDLSQLVENEDLLDNFIVGFLVGEIAQGKSVVDASKQGQDFVTGLNDNEQKVIDKVYENAIAEQEADGKKLTAKDKSKLYDTVQNQLERGEIDIDTIEEVLGGESYSTYKNAVDNENALKTEFDTLNKMKQGDMTGEQMDRRAELKQQLEELKNNSNTAEMKTKLGDEVFSLVKDSKLAESYNQRAKRGQAFTADLSQYDTKYQDTIKKAVESGILNDTRRTHEFVDMIAKISADKGVLFDFTNNEKLANSRFAVEGKTVNGYVDGDTIGLNIDSPKALEKTVGHEVTHILEGTEFYDVLQNTITEYAKAKGDYDGRLETLTKLYEGIEGADVNKELTADLVGDYLFTDTDFINKLSTQNRNLFQKIYDEIKYLCKVATAGSKEARELERVKKAFEDAYRNGGTNTDAKAHSLSNETQQTDNEGVKLSKAQQDYFKDSKMRDDNGNLKVMYHGTEYAGFHEFNSRFSDDDKSFFFVDSNEVAQSYSGSSEVYTARSFNTVEEFNQFFEEIDAEEFEVVEYGDKYALLENGDVEVTSPTLKGLYDEFCDYTGLGQGQANYKVYLNLTNPLEVDAQGRNWNRISGEFSQEVYDRIKSLTDEEKTALTQLATWEDSGIFRDEIQTAVESVERNANYVDEHIRNLASAAEKLGDTDMYRLFDIATDNFSEESLQENAVKYLNTRDYAQRAKEQGYDGVIFKNIVDNGGFSDGKEGASTVAIAFDSNQIKSVANDKPTSNADIRYSFAGVHSKTQDLSLYNQAIRLEDVGKATPEEIRQQTGWFRGYDGKWRYEISDRDMEIDTRGKFHTNPDIRRYTELVDKVYFDTDNTPTVAEIQELKSLQKNLEGVSVEPKTLGTLIKHDKLFAAYPQLKDIEVRFESINERGVYNPVFKEIVLNKSLKLDKNQLTKTLIHEMQHAIQDIEGFASGSSVEYWQAQRQDIVNTIRGAKQNLDLWLNDIGYGEFADASLQEVVNKEKTLEQHWEDCKEFKANSKYAEQIANCEAELAEFQRQYDEITHGMTPSEQYLNTAGEIEARDAAIRWWRTDEARKEERPDIDRTDVVFADDATRFSLSEPIEYTKDLIAMHNLNTEKLMGALKLGGLPSPSVAITKTDIEHSNYGDITMLLNKNAIDPQADSRNKVYGSDAWTPTRSNAQTEYEIDYDKMRALEKSLEELGKNVAGGAFSNGSLLRRIGIEDSSTDNASRIAEKLSRYDEVRAAYLASKGQNIEPEYKTKVFSKFGNEALQTYIDNVGVQHLASVIAETHTGEMAAIRAEEETVRKIIRDNYEKSRAYSLNKRPELKEQRIQAYLDNNVSIFTIEDFVKNAWEYYQDGGSVTEEIDRLATSDKLRQEVNDSDVKAWIEPQVEELLGEPGIYNGQDPYNQYGGRKGFWQTHYTYTAENVVKAMQQASARAEKTFGANANSIIATATPSYNSIEEMHADKGRLQLEEQETYSKILGDIQDGLYAIEKDIIRTTEHHTDNQYDEEQIIGSIITEAGTGERTVTAIQRAFAKEGYKITAQQAEKIIDLYNKAASAPTGYFEAKPQRVVNFDEVAAVIIPNNIDVKLKQELLNRGFNIAEYDPNIEGDRQRVVNQFEDLRFSLSDVGETVKKQSGLTYGEDIKLDIAPTVEDIAPTENVEDYSPDIYDAPITEEQANAMASERLDSITDADVPIEVEDGYYNIPDTSSIDNKTLKNIGKSLRDTLSLTPQETKAIQEIVQEYSTSEAPSREGLFDTIKEKFAEKHWKERNNEVAEVKRWLRNLKINVSQDVKSGIDGYSEFRKIHQGKIGFSKQGIGVDSAYQELNELYPDFFPADIINPADQLLRMGEVADMEIYTENSYTLDDDTIQEAVNIITNEVRGYKDDLARTAAEETARADLHSVAPPKVEQVLSGATVKDNVIKQPIKTVEVRQAKKLQSLKTELADNQQLRRESLVDFDKEIERLTQEYLSKKDKNTQVANNLIRRISRLQRLKQNVDADYSKHISDLEARIEETEQNVKTEKEASILTDEPKVEKKKNRAWSKFKSNFLDKGIVFEELSRKTKNRELQARYNTLHYSDGRAQNFIGKGAEGVEALNDIQKTVEKAGHTQQLYEYLYHNHNIDRMTLAERFADAENKPVFGDYVTADVSQKKVAELEKANPKLKEYAESIYVNNKYLRNMLVEGGVISQETADLWEEMYPHYVPVRRVDDNGLNINVALDTNRTGINAPVKRATGGNSDILPLFDTMAQRAIQTYKAVAKNRFGVELKNTLGTTIETAKTNLDESIASIENQDELLQEGKNGQAPTFTVFENGERVTFEITEDMYDALKPTSEGFAYTNKILNTVSNVHRNLLTTHNLTFMFTNAPKDAQDVLWNSQHPIKTYANFPTAFKEIITNGKYYQEYIENGGEQNTYFDKQSNTFAKEKSGISKVIGFPLEKISQVNDFVEKIPRLAEYIASRKKGASVDVSMLDAARVTTNFNAGGDVTKFLNRNGATFLNASIQGAMQNVRNIQEAKAKGLRGWAGLVGKATILGASALFVNGLLWDDDEDYEELSDYVKDNYYIVAKYGDGKFVRIPKGRTTAVILNAFEQMKNAFTGDDDVDFNRFFELVMNNLAPNNPITDNIIAPITQVANNETWYGDDLVPTRLQDLPGAEQYDESTDAISKWLGEKLDYSPYKINYLLNQYSGGVGDLLLPMLTPEAENGDNSLLGNFIAPLKDKFTTDSTMKNQNVSDFYDAVDELTTNAKSSKATDEDVLKYKYINSVNAELGELYKQKREIQNSAFYTDAEKYEAVREIQEQIDSIAENSLDTYKDVYIDGHYATVGDKQYLRNSDYEWEKADEKQIAKYEWFNDNGISYDDYLGADEDGREAYNWAYNNPEKFTLSKAVSDDVVTYRSYTSDLYDIKADKDASGDTIAGTGKEKKLDYINSLDELDYGQKCILFRTLYSSKDDKANYNPVIIDYLNEREDISYEEMVTILEELDMTVDEEGYIYWD